MDKLWKDNKHSVTIALTTGVGLVASYMIYKKLAENEQIRLEKEKADKEAEATRKRKEEEDRILADKIRQDRLEKEKVKATRKRMEEEVRILANKIRQDR